MYKSSLDSTVDGFKESYNRGSMFVNEYKCSFSFPQATVTENSSKRERAEVSTPSLCTAGS